MNIFDFLFNFTSNCSICCEDISFQHQSCKTKCMHHFHYDCLTKWSIELTSKKRNFNCPVCRTDLTN